MPQAFSQVPRRIYSAGRKEISSLKNKKNELQAHLRAVKEENYYLQKEKKFMTKLLQQFEGNGQPFIMLVREHSDDIKIMKNKLSSLRNEFYEEQLYKDEVDVDLSLCEKKLEHYEDLLKCKEQLKPIRTLNEKLNAARRSLEQKTQETEQWELKLKKIKEKYENESNKEEQEVRILKSKLEEDLNKLKDLKIKVQQATKTVESMNHHYPAQMHTTYNTRKKQKDTAPMKTPKLPPPTIQQRRQLAFFKTLTKTRKKTSTPLPNPCSSTDNNFLTVNILPKITSETTTLLSTQQTPCSLLDEKFLISRHDMEEVTQNDRIILSSSFNLLTPKKCISEKDSNCKTTTNLHFYESSDEEENSIQVFGLLDKTEILSTPYFKVSSTQNGDMNKEVMIKKTDDRHTDELKIDFLNLEKTMNDCKEKISAEANVSSLKNSESDDKISLKMRINEENGIREESNIETSKISTCDVAEVNKDVLLLSDEKPLLRRRWEKQFQLKPRPKKVYVFDKVVEQLHNGEPTTAVTIPPPLSLMTTTRENMLLQINALLA